MDILLKRIFRNAAAFMEIFFLLAKKIDYRSLSHYILGISQRHDMDGMLVEASKCLKEILNYRFLAFAVLMGDKVLAWVDPAKYKLPLKKIIEDDFKFANSYQVYGLKEDEDDEPDENITFKRMDLVSNVLIDEKYFAKLYILPDRRMFHYHHEILNIILQTLHISISKFLNLKKLENDAAIDPLTNCYNKREFERQMEHDIANSKRHGNEISIIMFDIDQFKMINDQYGHQTGDKVLIKISQAVQLEIRKGDYLSRYGGDEFVVVLPETKKARALEIAERLRRVIENLAFQITEQKSLKVTSSFGVASLKENSDTHDLLQEADTMLYKAKASGRNMVMPQLKLCAVDTVS